MNKYYVYAHRRNDNNSIFYIGKGSGKRAFIKCNRSEYWKRIVEKYGYTVDFLAKELDEETAFNLEILYIQENKKLGFCEANFSNGGDGVKVDKRWWNDKISKALIGIKRPSGLESKSYKDIISKEVLYDLYVTKKLNTIEISKLSNLSIPTICKRLEEYGIQKRKSGKASIKIICTTDNKIFESINEAADFYSLHRENIRKVLKGIYKTTGGKTFKHL